MIKYNVDYDKNAVFFEKFKKGQKVEALYNDKRIGTFYITDCTLPTETDEYIATIGLIDSSIVLCKFIDPHLSVYLIKYLLELHKRGRANEIHTKLLFNLFHGM